MVDRKTGNVARREAEILHELGPLLPEFVPADLAGYTHQLTHRLHVPSTEHQHITAIRSALTRAFVMGANRGRLEPDFLRGRFATLVDELEILATENAPSQGARPLSAHVR